MSFEPTSKAELLNKVDPTFRIINGALLIPPIRKPGNEIVRKYGKIYSSDSQPIIESIRWHYNNPSWWIQEDETMAEIEEILLKTPINNDIKGQVLYLGTFNGHYGHILVEMIPRLWPSLGSSSDSGIASGNVIVSVSDASSINVGGSGGVSGSGSGRGSIGDGRIIRYDSYIVYWEPDHLAKKEKAQNMLVNLLQQFLQTNDQIKVHLIDQPIRLSEETWITIPETLYPAPKTLAPEVLKRTYASLNRDSPKLSNKCYIGRSLSNMARKYHPLARNEDEIAKLFEQHGYNIVDTSKMTIKEQIAYFGSCSIIAGRFGTNTHNAFFMPEGSKVIILEDSRKNNPVQEWFDKTLDIKEIIVPFKGEIRKGRITFDIPYYCKIISSLLE